MAPKPQQVKKNDQGPRIFKAYYRSELGRLEIRGTEKGIMSLKFVAGRGRTDRNLPPIVKKCRQQIDEYFSGKRKKFAVKLYLEGTAFQKSIWKELLKVPFGKTAAYGEIARAAGNPKASRAVGNANNRNPVSIIIPCHRIVGSTGGLTGYGGGLWRKEWLLKHEGVQVKKGRISPKGS